MCRCNSLSRFRWWFVLWPQLSDLCMKSYRFSNCLIFSHPDLVSVDWFFSPHYEVQFFAFFFASLIIFYCRQDIVHCPSLPVGCGCCPLNSLQCSSDSWVSSAMSLCYFKTVWCVWVLYVRVLEKHTVMCVADLITTSTETRCICVFSPMSITWFG